MPLDLGALVNGGAEWLTNAPVIRSTMGNPVYTALLLTALVIVLLVSIKGLDLSSEWRTSLKVFIYILMGSVFVLSLHHYAMTAKLRVEGAGEDVRRAFNEIKMAPDYSGGAIYPVLATGGAASHVDGQPQHLDGQHMDGGSAHMDAVPQHMDEAYRSSHSYEGPPAPRESLHLRDSARPDNLVPLIVDVPLPAVRTMGSYAAPN
jgi:hypothetical protein